MKPCAVILNGTDVVKVSNLKRKYDKLINNPNVRILEECEKQDLDRVYLYWYNTLITSTNTTEQTSNNVLKYHWRNKITKHTHHSIYPELLNTLNPEEWEPYNLN